MVPPVGGVCMAAVHVKVVPLIVEFKVISLVPALQMVCGEAEPTGVGFTVTVIVYGEPRQLPTVDVGVTMY